MTLKITQPRPSLPVTQPRAISDLPARPAPRISSDDFEPTKSGPVSLSGATPEVAETSPGEHAIELAKTVMGQNAHDLKLANNTALGDAMQDWVGDKVNCANFVSGLLIATGQMPKSQGNASVVGLVSNLRKDKNFSEVSLDQAKPGDVVAFDYKHKDGTHGQHVMIFAGRDASGTPKFIGSNNSNADGTQKIGEMKGVPKGWSTMAVMHNNGPNSAPSNPASTPSSTSSTAPSAPTSTSPTDVAAITTDKATWQRTGSSGAATKDLQEKLKAAGFDPGPIDGEFGPKTKAAVLAFQRAKGIQVDGIVGPETRGALLGQATTPSNPSTGAEPPSTGVDGPSTTTPATTGTSATAQALEAEALRKHGPEFVQKVKEMATRLQVKPEWLLAVMKNESGMSTTAKNPNGGATGLIQFMPATARGLGTTTEALSKMSAVEQLAYVEKYFKPFTGKIKSGTDLYMATFWPAGVGKPDTYNIGGAEVARVNKIFDLNKNGQITAGEFRRYYAQRFPELT